jgi:DNA-binding MarR family transcriptional regulator
MRSTASTPNLSTLDMAASLRLSAARLARRLRQESEAGLTPSQLSALASIQNQGPLTLGALADHERVAPPTVTRIVAKLEAEGLVERSPDDDDKRVARVSTTRAGDALLERIRTRKNAWLAARLAKLDDDQRARLAAALDVLDQLSTDAP